MRTAVPAAAARRLTATLLALALGSLAGAAGAAPSTLVFSCRDDDGRLLTSDRPIPECADRTMSLRGPDGRLRREIEAPLSEEERQVQSEEDARRHSQRRDLDARSQRDRILIEDYRTVEKLERARARALAVLGQRAGLLRARIRVTEEHLHDNERAGGADASARHIGTARLDIAEDRAALVALEREVAAVNRRFDADAQRLRELRAER